MFGWGSVTTALNTDRHIVSWTVETATITVNKKQIDFGTPAQSDVQVVVRALCNTAANEIVQSHVNNTREWIASAEAKIASAKEYKRINNTFAEFAHNRSPYLQEGKTDNSDIIILKRHLLTDSDKPKKRIKIVALADNMTVESDEITSSLEFYSVIAGQFRQRLPDGKLIDIKSPDKFDLDTCVPVSMKAKEKLKPSLMLSQPFQNSLQLRGHMTTLVQALSSDKETGTNTLQEHYNTGNCFRNIHALKQELNQSVSTMANVLTRRKDKHFAPEFVILERGSSPIILTKKNETHHEQKFGIGAVQYRLTCTDSTSKTWRVFKKNITGTNKGYVNIGDFTLDDMNAATGTFVGKDKFTNVFQIPPTQTIGGVLYQHLSLDELYDQFNEAPRIRLYDDLHTTYITSQEHVSGENVIMFFTGRPLQALQCMPDTTPDTLFTEKNSDKNNVAFYSDTILQPCIQTCLKQNEEDLYHAPEHSVHQAVDLVTTDIPIGDTNKEFAKLCLAEVDEWTKKSNWVLRLVPVKPEDIVWMSSHENVIPEFSYHCGANVVDSTFSWYLGGSPSPALDVFEGALAFLNCEATKGDTLHGLVHKYASDASSNTAKLPADCTAFVDSIFTSDCNETETNLRRALAKCNTMSFSGKPPDKIKQIVEAVCESLIDNMQNKYWHATRPQLKWYGCLEQTMAFVSALLATLQCDNTPTISVLLTPLFPNLSTSILPLLNTDLSDLLTFKANLKVVCDNVNKIASEIGTLDKT